jgi:hypothetical protein
MGLWIMLEQKLSNDIVGNQCCTTVIWNHKSARMACDATMTLDIISARTTFGTAIN